MDTRFEKTDATAAELRDPDAFPRLDPESAARMAAYGREERLPRGTLLFKHGDRSRDFFLILEGSIEAFDLDDDGTPRVIVVQTERQFTGELDLFNDRQILVSGRTGMDSRLVRLKRGDFHRLVIGEPDIGEVIMRAFLLRHESLMRQARGGAVLIGPGHGADTLQLLRFLMRNAYPHRVLDTESDPQAHGLLASFALTEEQLPVVITPDHQVLRNPSAAELADALGVTETVDPGYLFDLAVVGAGPAGLAAAVYAASEGLQTVVIEALAPGGQAGTSSKIENYLGFPTGISGQELADRAQVQAQKFGARLLIARAVTGVDCEPPSFRLRLEGGRTLLTRAVIIATGARYRKLQVPELSRFEGQGIHYAATAMEAALCPGEEVIVTGGGNSAGQAAVFLSRTVAHVHMLVRGHALAATMSDYLVQRILSSPRITLHLRCEVTELRGDKLLREVAWTNRDTGERTLRPIGNVFVMIGADPNTGWLKGCVALDEKGFVRAGQDREGRTLASPYATTHPGVFTVGDVRAGSVKRVASSVGEGSAVVQAVHGFLHPNPE